MAPSGVARSTTSSATSKRVRGISLAAVAARLLVASTLAACGATSSPASGPTNPAPPTSEPSRVFEITVTNTSAGKALAGPNGKTLYIRSKDQIAASTCTAGPCAEAWEALVADPSMLRIGPGVSGTFGITIWPDGTQQVIHNGKPLYFYSKDQVAGDARGHGRGGAWCIAPITTESECDPLTAGETWNLATFHPPRGAVRAAEGAEDY